MVIHPMVQSVKNHLKNKSKNSIFDWSKGAVIPISQVSDEMPVFHLIAFGSISCFCG